MRAASKTTKTVLHARLRWRIIALKQSAITSIYETQPLSISDVLRRGAGNWLVFQPGRSGWAGSGEHGAWSVGSTLRRSTLHSLLTLHRSEEHTSELQSQSN